MSNPLEVTCGECCKLFKLHRSEVIRFSLLCPECMDKKNKSSENDEARFIFEENERESWESAQ